MNKTPKISVIVPVLNGEATIAQAMNSLRTQTLGDFEVLVIDDGSTDNTADIVQSLAKEDPRFRYEFLGRNYGVSFARNRAIDLAKGEWLALLDADDWYDPSRLEKLLAAAEEKQAEAVFDNLLVFDHATGEIVDTTHFQKGPSVEKITAQTLFERDTPFVKYAIGYAQPFVRTAFLRKKGIRYNETLRLGEDFAFLAEILFQGGRVFALPEAFYVYRHRVSPSEGSVSPFSRSTNDHRQIKEACRDLKNKYESLMSPRLLRIMKRRCGAFDLLIAAREAKALYRQGRVFSTAKIFLAQPRLALFLLRLFLLRCFRRRCRG